MLSRIWLGILYLVIVPPIFAQSNSPNQDYVPGHLIFRISPEYESQVKNSQILIDGWSEFLAKIPGAKTSQVFPNLSSPLARRNQTTKKVPNLRTIFYLSFEEGISVESAVRFMNLHPAVFYAEPWYIQRLFYQPNDARADTLGGKDLMWHLDQIQARQAWDLERNDTTVKIGIIDSGTWSDHPDLKDNLGYNYNDPIDGIDNDFDGYVDNFAGWDFGGETSGLGLGDNDPSIGNVHGLWVTGIVGATADNEIGIPGLCFNCEYLPIKGASDDAILAIAYGYQGIIYAAEQGSDVINCSWGGTFNQFGKDVVAYATQIYDVAIIAGCGNSGTDNAFFPAAFPEVISVANSSFGDSLFSNSTYHYSVNLSAPGNAIASTFDDDAYWSWGGTSASSPVVAGAVALTKAHFPELSPYQAAQRVRVTTDNTYDVNAPFQDKLGTGRVNMYRALVDEPKPSIRLDNIEYIGNSPTSNFFPGDTFYVNATWFNYLDSSQNLIIKFEESEETDYLELLDGQEGFTKVPANDRFGREKAFTFRVKENIPYDIEVYLKFTYEDPTMDYEDFEYTSEVINITNLNVTENDLHTTLSSSGNFGFSNLFVSRNQLGIVYKGRPNALTEAGLLVSDGTGRVSDRLRNGQLVENDFRILDQVRKVNQQGKGFQAVSKFDDEQAFSPIGLSVSHETFASSEEPFRNFILFRYVLENSSSSPIADIYSGLYADWDISPFLDSANFVRTNNVSSYNESGRYAYTYDLSGVDPTYYGIGLLSSQGFHTRALENTQSTPYTKSAKFNYLRTLPSPATGQLGNSTQGLDVAQFVSGGPIDLFSTQKDSLVFVLMASDSLEGLDMAMKQAGIYYDCFVQGKQPQNSFVIDQVIPKAGTPIQFFGQNPQADAWNWDFGNGDISTLSDPIYTYSSPGTYEVVLEVQRGLCQKTFSQTIEVNKATSLNPTELNQWALFPNPSRGSLLLRHPSVQRVMAHVRWTNIHGQVLRSEKLILRGQQSSLGIPENWPNGIYYVEIGTKELHKVLKLVLER